MEKIMKWIRVLGQYVFVLILGIAVGYVVVNFKALTTSPFIEGDFSTYYPDKSIPVAVYGTQTCPFCIKTREFLASNNIAFSDLDIDQSEKARSNFKALGAEGVPVVLIGNRMIRGFDEKQIQLALLKINQSTSLK